jgi:hypothetical protein
VRLTLGRLGKRHLWLGGVREELPMPLYVVMGKWTEQRDRGHVKVSMAIDRVLAGCGHRDPECSMAAVAAPGSGTQCIT